MKFLGDLNLKGNALRNGRFEHLDDFPEIPKVGTWAFIQKQLMLCVELEELPVWVPLTPERNTYPFEQPFPSDTWQIDHQLDQTEVVIQCFDASGAVLAPSEISSIDKNTTQVKFPEPVQGKAIVMYGYDEGAHVDGKFKDGVRPMPIGSVFRIYRTDIIPENCLPLMGQTITTEFFPELVAAITGDPDATEVTLDDARGVFNRNLDYGRGLDTDRVEGSEQDDMLGSHDHSGSVHNKDLGTKTTNTTGNHYHGSPFGENSSYGRYGNYSTSRGWGSRGGADTDNYSFKTSTNGNHNHSVAIGAHNHGVTIDAKGGHETRPDNVAYILVILAK